MNKFIFLTCLLILVSDTFAIRIRTKDSDGDEDDVETTIQEMSQLAEDEVTPVEPAATAEGAKPASDTKKADKSATEAADAAAAAPADAKSAAKKEAPKSPKVVKNDQDIPVDL